MSAGEPSRAADDPHLPPLLSVRQTAGILGLSERQVSRLCLRDELPAIKIGKVWRINRQRLCGLLGIELPGE